jgi:dihydroceramidase
MSSGWLPAYQYQPTENGFWFPPTATIDWCEERYYATHYIAEVVNATTNILFLALGIKGVVGCLKYGHDRIFLVSYIGYLLVGTGSFLFHTTLKCEHGSPHSDRVDTDTASRSNAAC